MPEFKEIQISLDFFGSFLCQDKNEQINYETNNSRKPNLHRLQKIKRNL